MKKGLIDRYSRTHTTDLIDTSSSSINTPSEPFDPIQPSGDRCITFQWCLTNIVMTNTYSNDIEFCRLCSTWMDTVTSLRVYMCRLHTVIGTTQGNAYSILNFAMSGLSFHTVKLSCHPDYKCEVPCLLLTKDTMHDQSFRRF
jgi:hypothetical protein